MKWQECEPSAHRSVNQCNGSVGGIHRPKDEDVPGQRERFGVVRGIQQVDRAVVAVFQQEVELTEDLGEVATVDLVDDQDVDGLGVVFGLVDK